jgi:hypothetical protein
MSLGVASATWGADKLQLGDLRPGANGSLPAAMPPEWAAHLKAGAPKSTSWSVIDDGRWVRHTSPNGDRLFTVGADGRLLDPNPPSQPPPSRLAATQWHDACVVSSPPSKGPMPRPPFDRQSRPTHPPHLRYVHKNFFWGGSGVRWSLTRCFDRESITHFKVKHATLRLTRLRALDLHPAEHASDIG